MDEYVGIIKPWAGIYVPQNWYICDGSLLPINQFQLLFAVIGNIYGGDGRVNFALPDLRGRVPLDMGTGPGLTTRPIGTKNGVESVTITPSTFPSHTHGSNGLNGPRETTSPINNYLGIAAGNFYCQQDPGDTLIPMNPSVISTSPGGSQPHNNMPPFLVVKYIICYDGLYPVRH
ncbi:phage tail protein [Emticicia fontis]